MLPNSETVTCVGPHTIWELVSLTSNCILMLFLQICAPQLNRVGSGSYLDSLQPSTQQFDMLGLWEGMRECLLALYKCARRTLAIPHTTCDVDRSFSMSKRVRSEKQYRMQHDTHKAYVSFCLTGVVPPL